MAVKWPNPVIKPATIQSDRFISRGGFIDIRGFGAVGDGNHDDTEAIHQAARFWETHGGTLFIPAGLFTLSRTLYIGGSPENTNNTPRRGLSILACSSNRRPDDNANSGSGSAHSQYRTSALVWTGEAGGTMLSLATESTNITGLSFWGTWQGGNRAGKGLLIEEGDSGVGTGKCTCNDVSFGKMDIGWQMGNPDTVGGFGFNADHGVGTNIHFNEVNVGYRCTHQNCMEHYFHHVNFVVMVAGPFGDPAGFLFESGGKLESHMNFVTSPQAELTILRIKEESSSFSQYYIDGIYIDGGTNSKFRVKPVDIDAATNSNSHGRVEIKNYRSPGEQTGASLHRPDYTPGPLIRIKGGWDVVMHNCSSINIPVAEMRVQGTNAPARLTFRDCIFWEHYALTGASGIKITGQCYWGAFNCRRAISTIFNDHWMNQGNLPGVNRSGQGTILDGNIIQTVTHYFGFAPRSVIVTARDSDTNLWISNVTTTTFRVNRTGSSGNLDFNWIGMM